MNEAEVAAGVAAVAQSNPLVGGGVVVGGVVMLLLLLLKAYNYLRTDNSLTSAQSSVILVLRQEVDRLSQQVQEGSQRERKLREELNNALDELARLRREQQTGGTRGTT
ncbi:TPA: hypothetical protein ACMFQN_005244 [Pseudomonas aeruginosa]